MNDVNNLNEELYRKVVHTIVANLCEKIIAKSIRYVHTVAGESGSGKSETSKAIAFELEKRGIKTVILGQDDYCYLTPGLNDIKRKEDSNWLGPHVEIKMDLLDNNLRDFIQGKTEITKPVIDPIKNTIEDVKVSLSGVKVVIAEGTYVSLLKNVDARIFIARTWIDTQEDRKKRNRRHEVSDPFTEQILITEHKIIAGHKYLADYIITNNYAVLVTK